MKKHISFSELKKWDFCPFYHKLTYIDGLKGFTGNIFTAFGSAIHHTCEKIILEKVSQEAATDYFCEEFIKEVASLEDEVDEKSFENMLPQGITLAEMAIPSLKKEFGSFELIGVEEKLYEPIKGADYNFKGFIDLIIKTDDGKYHVIDWKTCSWGWNTRKKTDPMVVYQLVLYKHYFSKKYNIEPKNIEAHFALLKRTAKKNNVEFLRVTTGPKRTKNSLDLLLKAVYNIKNKNFVKNKLKCENCEFYKTPDCPR